MNSSHFGRLHARQARPYYSETEQRHSFLPAVPACRSKARDVSADDEHAIQRTHSIQKSELLREKKRLLSLTPLHYEINTVTDEKTRELTRGLRKGVRVEGFCFLVNGCQFNVQGGSTGY